MGNQSARANLTIPGAIAMILAAAGASAQQAPPPDKPVLGEIIVTAQKRAQSVADIPMSVSVLPGEALERQQVDDFQDLVALVPGLSVNTNTRGVSRITLRGINTGGVASTVGIYVDDVPFGSSSGLANAAILSGDFDTFDMARIEVLRGPAGHAVRGELARRSHQVRPERADDRWLRGKTAGLGGGRRERRPRLLGDGRREHPRSATRSPFARAASTAPTSGFIDSIGNNPVPSLTNPAVNVVDGTRVEDDLNGLDTFGGRVAALFKPSDELQSQPDGILPGPPQRQRGHLRGRSRHLPSR